MKKSVLILTLAAALIGGIQYETQAQSVKVPPASSATTITQSIGIHDVVLKYNRPNANGRKVFGALVPFNEVWRLGANAIPSITFAEDVTVEGNKVAAGTYGLLAIPDKDTWTIIFSNNVEQWGAYSYKTSEDYLRFTVKPQTLKTPVETYTMAFDNVTPTSASLSIAWEKTLVEMAIKVDQQAEILASIDEAMQSDKKPYFQAAQYYYNNDLDIKKALEWINEADRQNPSAFYIKYWKAKIQLKSGDKAGAISTAKEGIALAEKASFQEYINLNSAVIKEAEK